MSFRGVDVRSFCSVFSSCSSLPGMLFLLQFSLISILFLYLTLINVLFLSPALSHSHQYSDPAPSLSFQCSVPAPWYSAHALPLTPLYSVHSQSPLHEFEHQGCSGHRELLEPTLA